MAFISSGSKSTYHVYVSDAIDHGLCACIDLDAVNRGASLALQAQVRTLGEPETKRFDATFDPLDKVEQALAFVQKSETRGMMGFLGQRLTEGNRDDETLRERGVLPPLYQTRGHKISNI